MGHPRQFGKVDYTYDPDSDKMTTVVEKSNRERGKDVERHKQKIRKHNLIGFYVLLVAGVVLNASGLATIAWFTDYIEQSTLTVEGDLMLRRCTFRMSYQGLKVYIDYHPDGENAGQATETVTEVDSYREFSQPDTWPDNYAEVVAQADSAGTFMLAFTILCILALTGAAGLMSLGLYKGPGHIKRWVYLWTFLGAVLMNCAATVCTCLFVPETGPFRDLLKTDSVARDTEPELVMGYSVWLMAAALTANALSMMFFWRMMPVPEDTAAQEAMTALQKAREKRIKQYMEDVTNDTYVREHWTVEPAVERSPEPKPRTLAPIEGYKGKLGALPDSPASPTTEENPLPGSVPSSELAPYDSTSIQPFSPKDSIPPPSSPLYNMRKEFANASKAQRVTTKKGEAVLLPAISEQAAARVAQDALAQQSLPSEVVIQAWEFRQGEGSQTTNKPFPEGARPMTRERPVSRAPPPERQRKKDLRTDLTVVVSRNTN